MLMQMNKCIKSTSISGLSGGGGWRRFRGLFGTSK